MQKGNKELGTEPIGKLIRKFSIPAIIGMLVTAVYNMVDQIYVGNGIGMLGTAATNVAFPLSTISMATSLLLGVGSAANFNLMQGRGEPEKAADIAGSAISLMIIAGVCISAAALIFLEPMLYVFGATETVMPYARPYTLIVILGIPFGIFATGTCALIRADGSPLFSMGCMLAGAIFNIVFDPIFAFVFGWGISGIAWATTLGQVLSAVIVLYYLRKSLRTVRLGRKNYRIRWNLTRMIAALGIGGCTSQMALTALQITMNNALRYHGAMSQYGSEIPLASVGIVSKVNTIFIGVCIGIAQGCQPINGYNYGAKNYDRVKKTLKTAMVLATAVSVVTFGVFQLFPGQIMRIFGEGSPEYFQFGIHYMRIFMLLTFVNGIQPIASTFFTAIGKARIGFLLSLTRQFVFHVPLILTLPLLLGIDGVVYAGPIGDVAAFFVAVFFTWREIRRINEQMRLAPRGA